MNVGGSRERCEAITLPLVKQSAGANGDDGMIKSRVVERGEQVPTGVPDSKVNISVHRIQPSRDRPALALAV